MSTIQRPTRQNIFAKASAVAVSAALVATCALPSLALADEGTTGSSASQGSHAPQGEPPDGFGGGSGGTPPEGTPPDGFGGGQGGQGGPGGGPNTQTFDYTGSYAATLTADGTEATATGEALEATDASTNVALATNGGTLTITGGSLNKAGDVNDGDSCNFYGVNSIVLAVGETSQAYISDATLTATSTGSNGIFATDNATIYANNVAINTVSDNSRGLDATYGGTIVANAMHIATQGDHCAATATDRGGGSVSVTNSTFSTAGSGSPLLYSTGDIEVDNVTGTATGSQIAGMEGLNTILISNSDLTSTITSATASDPIANAVIIYQSTSGDADTSTGDAARFQAVNSQLTSSIESGSFFYVTNTTANVVLENTTLEYDADDAALLTIEGNDANNWGKAGNNGATVSFAGISQQLAGDVVVDTISQLDMYLLQDSSWTGAAVIEENASGSTVDAPITVNIDATSAWIVTDNSTVSSLNVEDGGMVVDADGNTVTIVANGEVVVQGTSDLTVTVTGEYGTSFATDEAQAVSTDVIDRTGFDAHFDTNTTFGTNNSDVADAAEVVVEDENEVAESDAAEEEATDYGFFGNMWHWFLGLFGL